MQNFRNITVSFRSKQHRLLYAICVVIEAIGDAMWAVLCALFRALLPALRATLPFFLRLIGSAIFLFYAFEYIMNNFGHALYMFL